MSMEARSPVGTPANNASYAALKAEHDALATDIAVKQKQLLALAQRMQFLQPAGAALDDRSFSQQAGDPRVARAASQLNPNGAPGEASSLPGRTEMEDALKAAVHAKLEAEKKLKVLQSDLGFLKAVRLDSYLTQTQFDSVMQYGRNPSRVARGNVVIVKFLQIHSETQYKLLRYYGPSRENPETIDFSSCDDLECDQCLTKIATNSVEIVNIDQSLRPATYWVMSMIDPVAIDNLLLPPPDLSFLKQKKLGDRLTKTEFDLACQHARDINTPLQLGDIVLLKWREQHLLLYIKNFETSSGTLWCKINEKDLTGYRLKPDEFVKINKTFLSLQLPQNPPIPFRAAAGAGAVGSGAGPAPAAASAKGASAAGSGFGAAAAAAAAGAGALKVDMSFLTLPLESHLSHEQFQLFLTHGCDSDKRLPEFNERVVVRRNKDGVFYQLLEYFGPGISTHEGATTVFQGKHYMMLLFKFLRLRKGFQELQRQNSKQIKSKQPLKEESWQQNP
jgi:hypothetical protein